MTMKLGTYLATSLTSISFPVEEDIPEEKVGFDPTDDAKDISLETSPNEIIETANTKEALLSPDAFEIPFQTAAQTRANREDGIDDILAAMDQSFLSHSTRHFGYPVNMAFDYDKLNNRFLRYHINNCGDPFNTAHYNRVQTHKMEIKVLEFFAKLWKISLDQYWGYVTSGGTEGNMHGLLLARERFPDGILLTSSESHYSILKAAKYFRMNYQIIPTTLNGEIDYHQLEQAIASHQDQPIIINANIGTTVKGAIDDFDEIIRILDKVGVPRDRFHLHLDGALNGIMVPFIDGAPKIDFTSKPIDSIAVSGHKFLGCPFPCGITITRKVYVDAVSNYVAYIGNMDNTLLGSRAGVAAIYLWYALRTKGLSGLQADVDQCLDASQYLCEKLRAAGLTANVNPRASTVCLERPVDEGFIHRWQVACVKDIAHVVVMKHVTRAKIDVFVAELLDSIDRHGRVTQESEDSPLAALRGEW